MFDGLGGAVHGDGTLVAVQTFFSTNLQVERTVTERKTAIHTFSATDAKIMVDDVLEIRVFDEPPRYRVGGAELVFGSGISGEGLRIEKAGAEIAIAAHGVIVKALDRRNRFDTFVRTDSAADTFCGINLPNKCVAGNFLLGSKKADNADESGGNTASAARFEH